MAPFAFATAIISYRGQQHNVILNRRAGRASGCPRMTSAMAGDEIQIPLDEQLGEIGAQLDWVRGYL